MLIRHRREKVFGPGHAVPLDRNAKARIAAYARAWSARHRLDRQHKGPITRAFLEVLQALLWGFHNSRSGVCFPSYEAIALRAGCARSTVAEALKALEWAGVLAWQHRVARIRERCQDLFGRDGWRWRVIRTSNAYVFRDPASKSENPTGTQDQDVLDPVEASARNPNSPLEAALRQLGTGIEERLLTKGSGGTAGAPDRSGSGGSDARFHSHTRPRPGKLERAA
jgi:hypothetical protein